MGAAISSASSTVIAYCLQRQAEKAGSNSTTIHTSISSIRLALRKITALAVPSKAPARPGERSVSDKA